MNFVKSETKMREVFVERKKIRKWGKKETGEEEWDLCKKKKGLKPTGFGRL